MVRVLHVDAFTSPGRPFTGNPAGVVLLNESDSNPGGATTKDDWMAEYPSAEWMQSFAAEMNLSETAFVLPLGESNEFGLRWFTPTTEVDLCGHATLASAHAVLSSSATASSNSTLSFHSRSGILTVAVESSSTILSGSHSEEERLLQLNFPSTPPNVPVEPAERDAIVSALSRGCLIPLSDLTSNDAVQFVGRTCWDVFIHLRRDVFDAIPAATPALDMSALAEIPCRGIIVTAAGGTPRCPDAHFVSRFFGPGCGVPEDPVTGSAHCALTPYWADKLAPGATKPGATSDDNHANANGNNGLRDGWLLGYQASKRGGEVYVKVTTAASGEGGSAASQRTETTGSRVLLCGRAETVVSGTLAIRLPA